MKFAILGIVVAFCIVEHVQCMPNKDKDVAKKVVNLEVGGYCAAAAAPTGPGGSWQVIESDTVKVCPSGSSCRKGACNCDDLPDGTIMSHSWDETKQERNCKRVGGQKCQETSQCVTNAACVGGVCVCDKKNTDAICPEEKQDIIIMN